MVDGHLIQKNRYMLIQFQRHGVTVGAMKTVSEYRQFAASCREMAAKITDPKDKRAVELMAEAWDKVANDREAALKAGHKNPVPGESVQPS
jgi:hypothetical protein